MKKYLLFLLILAVFPLTAIAQQETPAPEAEETAVFVPQGEGICETDDVPLAQEAFSDELVPSAIQAGTTTRISIRSDGGQSSGGENYAPEVSADGRYVVFESDATNLLNAGNDTNDARDIFLHDRTTGQTQRVSIRTGGDQANGNSCAPVVSDDGRYIAFTSFATNLVDNDTNNTPDIFLHDRTTNTTILVSRTPSGGFPNNASHDPDISADGRYIVFWSYASNLVVNDTNNKTDVFRYDRTANLMELISVDTNEVIGNGHSSHPAISDDGTRIAFESEASNLVTGDGNNYKDIFLRNTGTSKTLRISFSTSGGDPNGDSWDADISGDGLYVVFVSLGSNLVNGDTNNVPDVFLRDRNVDATYLESITTGGAQANDWCEEPAISQDGSYVTFQSYATNLVSGDLAGTRDVFLRDRYHATLTRVSANTAGEIGNASSREPVISADGRYIVFSSKADNLVANDTNGDRDIFVHDTYTAPPPPPPASLGANYTNGAPGSYFAFTGEDFTANVAASLVINGRYIGPITVDSAGNLTFRLSSTGSTDEGVYAILVVQGTTSVVLAITLDTILPTRPLVDGGVLYSIPDGIALDTNIYLPVAIRS